MQNALLEHSAILLSCIKRLWVFKTNFCLLFERPVMAGCTVNPDSEGQELNEHWFRYWFNVCVGTAAYFPTQILQWWSSSVNLKGVGMYRRLSWYLCCDSYIRYILKLGPLFEHIPFFVILSCYFSILSQDGILLTHICISSFLWNTVKHCRPTSDVPVLGLHCLLTDCSIKIWIKKYHPTTLKMKMDWSKWKKKGEIPFGLNEFNCADHYD